MPRLFVVLACALWSLTILLQAEPLWVAVGQGGRRISSADGVHWENDQRLSDQGSDPEQTLFSIAFGKARDAKAGRFVAVGGGPETGRFMATEDGRKWLELPQQKGRVASIAFGQGRFVAAHGAELLYSTNGEQFTAGAKLNWPGDIRPRKVVFGDGEGGGMFVIIGKIDSVDGSQTTHWRAVSPDGQSFSKFEPSAPEARDLAFGSGHFVVVGPAGLIESSHDGLTWERRESDPAEDFQAVIWTGKRFIAQGNAVWTSPDALTWTRGGIGYLPGSTFARIRDPITGRDLFPLTLVWADELKPAQSIRALCQHWDGIYSTKDFVEWIKPTVPPGPAITAVTASPK